jgi:glycolate oxidase FAD binding subunit
MARGSLGTRGTPVTVTADNGVAGLSERIREARARHEPLRIVGSGTWLDAGRPCPATSRLDISGLRGITRYEPGDFVLTARAGTTLREIAESTAAFGQWITLDPVGGESSTIGSVVATASYGPLASAYGTPRDHVLGCEFVTGTGDIVRAGGQVVKNVAGFDLVRLVTGAWGTLGAITEVTLRVRARPEVDRTLAIALGDDAAGALWHWLRGSEFTPIAAELLSPRLAELLGVGRGNTALIRFGGNATLVRSAVDSAAAMGESEDVDEGIWTRLRGALDGTTSFRLSDRPSRIAAVWDRVRQSSDIASATVGRGMVRCVLPDGAQSLPRLDESSITCIGERLPTSLWPSVSRNTTTSALSARVRRTFDPDGVLNPGILSE